LKKRKDILVTVGIGYLGLLLVFAVIWPLVGYKYDQVVGKPFEPAGGRFLLGTDELGRDVLARLAYGARISLFVGFVVQILAVVVGLIVGVVSAYSKKWISTPLMRFTDGMFAFPDILLAILIIAVWKPGILPVIVALSVTAWPSYARLMYTQIVSLKDREFAVAAKAAGGSTFYVVTRHILSQLWTVIFAVGMVGVAGTILDESTLSFLGIGVQPPMPSWGIMIETAHENMNSHPEMLLAPCILLSLTIFALNFAGDGLRAYFDPKTSR
jgi:ABC-type dipeptide/oligopeptide/nickel transport system permease subunit